MTIIIGILIGLFAPILLLVGTYAVLEGIPALIHISRKAGRK